MCQFLSGAIAKGGQKLYFGLLNSHNGIEDGHNLKPDSYREFEWTKDDDGESLEVRTSNMDKHDSEWYKEKILSKYQTRQDLLKYISTIVCKSSELSERRYNENGMEIAYDSWHNNGQKNYETRCNKNGKIVSYDSWYKDGQKELEIRYNENGQLVSCDRWYKNGQKKVERRYNDNGMMVSYDSWYENGQKRE